MPKPPRRRQRRLKDEEPRRYYQRANGRFYGDFRDYRDTGHSRLGKTGKDIALVAPGMNVATRDSKVAKRLAKEFEQELLSLRERRSPNGLKAGKQTSFTRCAALYIEDKRDSPANFNAHEINRAARTYLRRAEEFFKPDTPVDTITVADVKGWLKHLAKQPRIRNGKRLAERLGGRALQKHLYALSPMFDYAVESGYMMMNPVRSLRRGSRPTYKAAPAPYLEVDQMALLLEAARVVPSLDRTTPGFYQLVATMSLAGLAPTEAYGLLIGHVDLKGKTLNVQPNEWRELKTESRPRHAPLFDQLAAILTPWLAQRKAEGAGRDDLLFPNEYGEMVRSIRDELRRVAKLAGFNAKTDLDPVRILPKALRTTFVTARCQCVAHGERILPSQIRAEIGHTLDSRLIEKTYDRVAKRPRRGEQVIYDIAEFEAQYADRLTALRASGSE